MSGPLQQATPVPQKRPIVRRKRRWILAAALVLPFAIMGGAWLAWPQARSAMAGYGAQALSVGHAALADLASRVAGKPAMAAADNVRGVRVMTVRLVEQHVERRFTGVVAARYETQIGFRVGGKIAARQIEVGQVVKRGDILMTLDDADYQAALRAAEANLAAANAQKTQALAEEARQKRLLDQGWTTRAAYDRVHAAARSAEEQVKAAVEQVELARNTLGYARLAAPDDGIVTAIRAEAGQVVPQGQPVLTLVRAGEREAVIAMPEGQIGDVHDWTAQASFWARNGNTEPAILREVSPQADPTSRTHTVRYSLPDGARSTELGATVTLTLRRKSGEPAASLPASAVFFKDGRPMVWRVKPSGNRLETVPVTIVTLGAERSLVSGLAQGDTIVTLGAHRLDEGTLIRAVEDKTPPARIEAIARGLTSIKVSASPPITGAEADAICMGQ